MSRSLEKIKAKLLSNTRNSMKLAGMFKKWLKEDVLSEEEARKIDGTSTSLFTTYKDEFKQFLDTELDAKKYASLFNNDKDTDNDKKDSESKFKLDVNNLNNIKYYKYRNKFENSNKDKSEEQNEADFFSEILSDLAKDENFIKNIDVSSENKTENSEEELDYAQGDGEIGEYELGLMVNKIDADSDGFINEEELMQFISDVKDNNFKLDIDELKAHVEEQIEAENSEENAEIDEAGPQGYSGSAGGYSGGSYSSAPINAVREKTEAELQNELKEAQNNTSKLNNVLNAFQSEDFDTLEKLNADYQELKDAKETKDEAYDNFKTELEQINSALAAELDSKKQEIDATNKSIDETQVNINDTELDIHNKELQKTSLDNQIKTLDSQISALKEQKNLLSGDTKNSDQISKIQEKISEAEALKEQMQAESDKLQEEITTENEKLTKYKENLKELQTALSEQQNEMQTIQNKVSKLQSVEQSADDEISIAGLMDKWLQAEETYKTKKDEIIESQKAQVTKSKETEEDISKNLDDKLAKKLKTAYSTTAANVDYTFKDGTQYKVTDFNIDLDGDGNNDVTSLEEFQQLIVSNGLTNTGQYGAMQCFNYSQEYCQLIMGLSSEAIMAAIRNPNSGHLAGSLAKYYDKNNGYNNQRSLMETVPDSSNTSKYDIIATEIMAGRPCVVGIPRVGAAHETHYGIACGIREGATAPYSESDFLIIDSYDGNIERGGQTNSFNDKRELFTYNPDEPNYHYLDAEKHVRRYSG